MRAAGLLHILVEAEPAEPGGRDAATNAGAIGNAGLKAMPRDEPPRDRFPEPARPSRPAGPDDVGRLNLQSSQVTDEGLSELVVLNNLRELDLRETEVWGTGIQQLGALRRLDRVFLSTHQVTDSTLRGLRAAGLLHVIGATAANNRPAQPAELRRRPRLGDFASINLAHSKVTDAGLKELAAFENLEELHLPGSRVTGTGFQELAGLATLRSLDLDDSELTDAGLKGLAHLKGLEQLSLRRTGVTDAGLKELAGLENLRVLALDGTRVTDAGLKAIAGLKGLRNLTTSGTRVTDAGLREFAGIKAVREIKPDQLLITSPGVPVGYQTFVVNGDGTGRTQLTVEPGGAFDAARSPDGKRIAFVTGRTLCLSNADSTGRQSIKNVGDMSATHFAPTWSPDGKRIAFSVHSMTGRGAVVLQIFVVDADGRNPQQLGRVGDLLPAWSPDGKRLLFNRTSDPGGLCVMDVSGGNVHVLVEKAFAGTWSPDGRSLAYVVFEDDAPRLYVSRADGSHPRQISGRSEAAFGPAHWSPDGGGCSIRAGSRAVRPRSGRSALMVEMLARSPRERRWRTWADPS